jgi:hypothetical protein
MIANLKSVSLAYYKNWIIKVLFNYMKYLIIYQNIIIIIIFNNIKYAQQITNQ